MSDLYVPDRDHLPDVDYARRHSFIHKASRSDVLEWLGALTRREKLELLGWEECPNYNVTDHSECHCAGLRLVPPASQVKAAAQAHAEADGFISPPDNGWDLARAALIAAMREGVGDE